MRHPHCYICGHCLPDNCKQCDKCIANYCDDCWDNMKGCCDQPEVLATVEVTQDWWERHVINTCPGCDECKEIVEQINGTT